MLLVVLACDTPEPEPPPDSVTWSGWVYASPEVGDETRLEEGFVTAWPEPFTGDPVAAEQPYADYPGYWQLEVPPSIPLNLRLSGEGIRPTVWAGDSPGASGSWFSGALFAATDAWLEDLFDAVDGDGDAWVDAARQDQVLLVGAPADDSVDCATLEVNGEPPTCWVVDADGVVSRVREGVPSLFAAAVGAGDVVVAAGDAEEHYVADGGDVVFAYFFYGTAP